MPLLKEVFITEITGQEFDSASLGDAVHYTTKMIVEDFLGEKEGGPSWHKIYGDVWDALKMVVKKHAPNAQVDDESDDLSDEDLSGLGDKKQF